MNISKHLLTVGDGMFFNLRLHSATDDDDAPINTSLWLLFFFFYTKTKIYRLRVNNTVIFK